MDIETCIGNGGQYASQLPFEDHIVSSFEHQVGGRAEIVSIYQGEDKSIGKPLNETEHEFYETAAETLPDILLGYIPYYKGVVEIKNGKTRCMERKLKSRPKGLYIVLEDITSTFKKPSIMDLKMGTRQYSDTMHPDKIGRKKHRSVTTTSHQLGLRVAAIRSYNSSIPGQCYKMNKLQGRALTTDTVFDAFRMFFTDGKKTRYEVISSLLQKLYNIINSIEQVNIRLYCCSLLLVYESDITAGHKIDIRIIDFAEYQSCDSDGEKYRGPDKGFLLGLNTLAKILLALQMEGKNLNGLNEDKE